MTRLLLIADICIHIRALRILAAVLLCAPMVWATYGAGASLIRDKAELSGNEPVVQMVTPALERSLPNESLSRLKSVAVLSADESSVLLDIYQTTAKAGVRVSEMSYSVSDIGVPGIRVLQISMPVVGRYEPATQCVLQLLARNRSLSLDGLSFKRDTSSSADLSGEVRFRLFVRSV